MKRQHYPSTMVDRDSHLLGNSIEGANYMVQMQFNCNKCNSTPILSNTFNTHMQRITFLWQLFQGSQLHESKVFVKLDTFQPCFKKPWGQNFWPFSKSEIKHGFHIIISITQRMAALNKVKVKMIKRLPRARAKPNPKGQGQKLG